jgi:hypothetical protein
LQRSHRLRETFVQRGSLCLAEGPRGRSRVDVGAKENLIGEKVPNARHGRLVEKPRFDSRPVTTRTPHDAVELFARQGQGVRSEFTQVRIDFESPETSRIVQ